MSPVFGIITHKHKSIFNELSKRKKFLERLKSTEQDILAFEELFIYR